MRKKICKEAGCSILIDSGSTYCEKHLKPKRVPFQSAVRSNDGLYNTTRWRKLRKKILSETPYCIRCGSDISLEIHHKIPPRGDVDLFYYEDNCVPVCGACHRLITASEISGRKSSY